MNIVHSLKSPNLNRTPAFYKRGYGKYAYNFWHAYPVAPYFYLELQTRGGSKKCSKVGGKERETCRIKF